MAVRVVLESPIVLISITQPVELSMGGTVATLMHCMPPVISRPRRLLSSIVAFRTLLLTLGYEEDDTPVEAKVTIQQVVQAVYGVNTV